LQAVETLEAKKKQIEEERRSKSKLQQVSGLSRNSPNGANRSEGGASPTGRLGRMSPVGGLAGRQGTMSPMSPMMSPMNIDFGAPKLGFAPTFNIVHEQEDTPSQQTSPRAVDKPDFERDQLKLHGMFNAYQSI